MRGIVTESRPTGLLAAGVLAAVLATGWSGGSPAPHKATVNSCYAFSVGALQRHIKVTAVPPACAGLSHAQINLAVARAVRTVIGSRPKPAARRAAIGASRYLAHLIETVPPPKPAAPPAPPPPSRNSTLPLSLAALAAWVATAAAGGYLMAGWLAHGGLRRPRTTSEGMPPVIIRGHFGLGLAGLAVWIAYVATNVKALAWTGVGVILPEVGLGMATLITALPEPAPTAVRPAAARPGGALPGKPGSRAMSSPAAGADDAELASGKPALSGPPLATRIAETAAPAPGRIPVILIAVHGALATTAVLLVILAAVTAG